MRTVGNLGELRSILERAAGSPGREHDGFATVEYTHGVITAQRVSIWVDGSTTVLGTWIGELKPQYSHFYSSPAAVEGLLGLTKRGWQVRPNLHLAYFRCPPHQRWYPAMPLSAEDYVRRWTRDLSMAGRKPREVVAHPAFGRSLVDDGFIDREALDGLQGWLYGHTRREVDVRPSIAVEWRFAEASPSVVAVRSMVAELLTAIEEPALP